MNKKYTIIDLFAGTSALSEGFVNHGFVPLAHVEMDKDACFTIKTRVAYHYLKSSGKLSLYRKYLSGRISREELYSHIPKYIQQSVINREISDISIPQIFKQIESSRLYKKNNRTVDFIVGGPPCQAYSTVVRHKDGIETDDRCYLYRQYGKFLEHFNPKGFVFENVVGLKSAAGGLHYEELQKLFKGLHYKLFPLTLKAEDYGVLQKRRRLIIFGWREDLEFDGEAPRKILMNWTTKDIFSDLADIQAGCFSNIYKTAPNEYLSSFCIRTLKDILTWHQARPLNAIDRRKYEFAVHKLLDENRRISYLEFDECIQTMKKGKSFTDRFKVVDPNGLCQTVVAHLSRDGHYYIYPSLDYVRSISVREAARLQSFPDNFFFEGSRGAAFRQIGNAVPPLLSEAIATRIIEVFTDPKNAKIWENS